MLLINNINVPLETDFSNLAPIVAEKIRISYEEITSISLYKRSLDARHKDNIHFCISVLLETKNEKKVLNKCKNALVFNREKYVWKKARPLKKRPVIVGFGPSGMFAALCLARAGLNPLVIERGKTVEERTADVENFLSGGALNTESNVQFGEGGAGTFSDGKLNTGIKDARCSVVLETFAQFGANKDILVDAKPHIGTDVLKKIVKNIRQEIISLGGEILFFSKLDSVFINDGKLEAISVNGEKLACEYLLLCIGHSARDTFEMLYKSGLKMERKPFSIGVRIEHLQSDINTALYGKFADTKLLKAAEYKMAVHLENGRGVYTFCMCPGGEVINASSEDGAISINGMSNSKRDGHNANSALLVGIEPQDLIGDDVFEGCRLQQRIEQRAYGIGKGAVPITTVGHFVFGEKAEVTKVIPTVKPTTVFAEFEDIFPQFITESLKSGILKMDHKIKGFADHCAILTAPETRSSSPIRILRGENKMCLLQEGIYPCGEGAGYAGGIMSAAVDGLKVAESLIENINSKVSK